MQHLSWRYWSKLNVNFFFHRIEYVFCLMFFASSQFSCSSFASRTSKIRHHLQRKIEHEWEIVVIWKSLFFWVSAKSIIHSHKLFFFFFFFKKIKEINLNIEKENDLFTKWCKVFCFFLFVFCFRTRFANGKRAFVSVASHISKWDFLRNFLRYGHLHLCSINLLKFDLPIPNTCNLSYPALNCSICCWSRFSFKSNKTRLLIPSLLLCRRCILYVLKRLFFCV